MRKEKEGDVFFELDQAERMGKTSDEREEGSLTWDMGPIFTIMCCK